MNFLSKKTRIKGDLKIRQYKFCGLRVLKKVKNDSLRKVYLLGLEIYKEKHLDGINKYYLLGVPIYSKRYKREQGDLILKIKDVPSKLIFRKQENPLVSIIVPTYNHFDNLKQCLTSILKFSENVDYEVIVADDNSTDETQRILEIVKNVKLIKNQTRIGIIDNIKNASRYARGKYLYFLNDKTIVQPGWLSAMLKVFEQNKKTGIVGSKIFNQNRALLECGGYIFSDCYENCSAILAESSFNNYLRNADYVSICSLLTPRDLFNQVGGFSSYFEKSYISELDYCIAVKEKGYEIYVQPLSKVVYSAQAEYETDPKDINDIDDKELREKWSHIFSRKVTQDLKKLPFTDNKRPKVLLVIDDKLPEKDKHAGGRSVFNFIEAFLRLGICVKFCPFYDRELNTTAENYIELVQSGVEVIHAKGINVWIDENINRVDYILFSRPDVIKHFQIKSLRARGPKILFYGHDLHHLRMAREMSLGEWKKDDEFKVELMREIEKVAILCSDKSYYPSSEEVNYVKKWLPEANVDVLVPYAYEYTKRKNCELGKNLIFVGSIHKPNIDAINWLIGHVWTKVHEALPGLKLFIVGGVCRAITNRRNLNSQGIFLLGEISNQNLGDIYRECRLAVAPLRFGAGVKGKCLDAIAHGVPVITTEYGAEGIPQMPFIHVVQLDSFAEELIGIYKTSPNESVLQKTCENFIVNNYSATKMETKFAEEIDVEYVENV